MRQSVVRRRKYFSRGVSDFVLPADEVVPDVENLHGFVQSDFGSAGRHVLQAGHLLRVAEASGKRANSGKGKSEGIWRVLSYP